MTRVLIVEDSPTQAESYRLVLEANGFVVEVRLHPEAALARIDDGGLDLVLSDIVMPALSGYELCRRIKARPRGRELAVVLLTALESPSEILNALECGADGFIHKARGAQSVAERLRNILATREARRTASSAGLEVVFLGKKFTVASGREQILDLLINTFEDSVRTNRALEESMAKVAAQNEALVRAERLKKDLTSLLVHDLKSPAAGLMMLARNQLKRAGAATSEERAWQLVFSTAETCQRMALNLLDIARSEDGLLTPERTDFELADLVAELRSILGSVVEERRQTLEVSLELDDRPVSADRSLLARTLLNLLDNAIRHAPAESAIRLRVRMAAEGVLEIRVLNDGPPIPHESREKIFDRYARLDADRDPHLDTGRGLGLSFCRLATEAQGGSIRVEDDPDAATAFVLRIPQSR